MSRHGLTIATGSIQQSRAHVTTDADRDRYLASVHASDTAGVITRPSGEARRLEDASTKGQAAGWNHRQQKAAWELERYWREALPGMAKPAGYRSHSGQDKAGERHLSPEEQEACANAWRSYSAGMDEVLRQCGQRHRDALFSTVIQNDAPGLDRAWRVRECLSVLADHWRIK